MFKKTRIFMLVIVILLVGILLYLKTNPPLDVPGLVIHAEQTGNVTTDKGNLFVIVAQPENNGFINIKLKDVLINSNEKAY